MSNASPADDEAELRAFLDALRDEPEMMAIAIEDERNDAEILFRHVLDFESNTRHPQTRLSHLVLVAHHSGHSACVRLLATWAMERGIYDQLVDEIVRNRRAIDWQNSPFRRAALTTVVSASPAL